MRPVALIFLLLLSGLVARGQSPSSPAPDVMVVKFSWDKERIGWEGDPFSGTNESFDDMRRRAADDKRRERAQASGNIGEANRIEREARAEQVLKARPPAPPRYAFVYRVTVKNLSEKTIKEFDWDYIFLDAATQEEIGRRQFTAVEKIAPGKTKELSFYIRTAPAKTISVYALEKKERIGLAESVVVVRVAYSDGSVWQQR